MDVVEKIGSGIKRIRDLCREHGVAEPVIDVSEHWVTVTFPGRPPPSTRRPASNPAVKLVGNYADYRNTVPNLFHHNAVVMFGNGEKARIGSITSRWGHFHEWKRLAEEEPGAVDMETLLKGVCDKRNFLDLVENFILFDESSGETRKILARNHQFLGVNRAVEAVRERKGRAGKLGVFWHTQGAGKSYSMVMFTRKVRRKLGGNFTFLVLTDRDDLDTRIYKTLAGCGVMDHLDKADIQRIKTVSKELLRTLKAERLRVDQSRDKEATRSAVHVAIRDFLYSDETGLPAGAYSDEDVTTTTEAVFAHVYRAYPTVPSPFYDDVAVA